MLSLPASSWPLMQRLRALRSQPVSEGASRPRGESGGTPVPLCAAPHAAPKRGTGPDCREASPSTNVSPQESH